MTAAPYDVVDTLLDEFFGSGGSPGLAWGVVHRGRLVHEGARGLDRIGGSVPTSRSVFRIASMSKSFVAATVLSLRDEGRLALDAPVAAYVPELVGLRGPTSDSPAVTVRDLLTMAPGWVTDDPWADRLESMQPDDYTRLLAGGFTFDRAPGTAFEYSNLGYTVLGRVITNVAGVPFQEAVRSRMLDPLGLTSTGFRLSDVPSDLLADGHFRLDDAWHVEPASETGEFAALGGLFSTVEDLAVWVGVLCGAFPARDDADPGVPLVRASIREMQQMHRYIGTVRGVMGDPRLPGEAAAYGFGLMVVDNARHGTFVMHGGGYPGYGTHMVWHPASGYGVIGLANARYAGPYRATAVALAALLDALDEPASVVVPSPAMQRVAPRVDALVESWDDALADELFASNVDADLPRDRRRADVVAAVEAVGGLVGPASDHHAAVPSRLSWWRPGVRGRVRVEAWLTPEAEPRVQRLDVRAAVDPHPSLRAAASAIAAALLDGEPAWPAWVPVSDDVDLDALLAEAARCRAAGVAAELGARPTSAPTAYDATFEALGPEVRAALTVALDDDGAVTACRIVLTGDEWPTGVRTRMA